MASADVKTRLEELYRIREGFISNLCEEDPYRWGMSRSLCVLIEAVTGVDEATNADIYRVLLDHLHDEMPGNYTQLTPAFREGLEFHLKLFEGVEHVLRSELGNG